MNQDEMNELVFVYTFNHLKIREFCLKNFDKYIMDDYVKSHLKQWELEELIPKFEEEEVNEKAFKCLSDGIIRELKLGKRAIFQSAYRNYMEAQSPKGPPQLEYSNDPPDTASIQRDEKSDESNDCSSYKIEVFPLDEMKLESMVNNDTSIPDMLPSNHPENENEMSGPDSNENNISIPFSIAPIENLTEQDHETAKSLRTLLVENQNVSHLLNKSFLTRESRIVLSEEIVRFLFERNDGVSFDVLQNWARAVEIMFCEEVAELYFRRTSNNRLYGGKFYESYQRLKRSKISQTI
ncbi:uncharacterized protein LOC129769607 [Toxorhynchites rutilus septentrionalis]|uniref:uncharacterized protein LOC129769607 n=1 Tax=Toxorhynchites rutilus septentrionalis TaxID=329112 RepID=UPI0024793315|nr:uncharacterized protein LOC129769607 [Toxorhynchites rutilus septentrionalis]